MNIFNVLKESNKKGYSIDSVRQKYEIYRDFNGKILGYSIRIHQSTISSFF